MGNNIFKVLLGEVQQYLKPLLAIQNSPEKIRIFCSGLGWDISFLLNDDFLEFNETLNNIIFLIDEIKEYENISSIDLDAIDDILSTLKSLFDSIEGLKSVVENLDVEIAKDFSKSLLEGLFLIYLANRSKPTFRFFELLGVIYYRKDNPILINNLFVKRNDHIPKVSLSRLIDFVTSPIDLFRTLYFPNGIPTHEEAIFVSAKLFGKIERFLNSLGIDAITGSNASLPEEVDYHHKLKRYLTIRFGHLNLLETVQEEFSISVGLIPEEEGTSAVTIIPNGTLSKTFNFSNWLFSTSVSQNFGILNIEFDGNVQFDPLTPPSMFFSLSRLPGASIIIGSKNTGVTFNNIILTTGLQLKDSKLELSPYLFIDGSFSISSEKGDGFLSKILSSKGSKTEFDFSLGWSKSQSFYFEGNASLEIIIPMHPSKSKFLQLKSFHLGIETSQEEGIAIVCSTSGTIKMGPIDVTVEKVGLKSNLTFPQSGGNLGFVDAGLKFKGPNGIGININTTAIQGGGYLYINQAEGRYAGVAGLSIKDKIQLSAFGLIATKLPSGQKGYSFLLFISAEFTPIQLGMGFTLNGVGGLVGIHRTVNIEKLRSGVKTGMYDRLLFPANPVEDALEIIADLRAIFPIKEGRHVFGLMGKIAWGTPTLITIDLGLIIEVPKPIRFAILGVVKAVLPDEKGKILKLKVNFLGVIDFGQKRLAFDASIYDSRLLNFTLSGDMAMRLAWGNNKNFILSVGGFHPSFQAPAGLTGMKRMTLSLLPGKKPKLTLSTYFAVTSNTVQFGAKVELFVKVRKRITAEGHLGFDALFQFDPFYMHILASAYMAVKWKGKEKFSVTLNVSLEGPTPWIVDGIAKIKICGIKAKVKVKKTWGKTQNTSLPPVAVGPLLKKAIEDNRNWETIWPGNNQQLVKLLDLSSEEKVLHPMGRLKISQKVIPLNMDIQLFGNQEVSDRGEHVIELATIGGVDMTDSVVSMKEEFAPAHFRKMTETQKLSSPSFVQYDGGIIMSEDSNLAVSEVVNRTIKYETIVFDSVVDEPGPFIEEPEVLTAMVAGGAAGQSALSFSPTIAPLAPNEITVLEEEYGVMDMRTNQLFVNEGETLTDNDSLKNSFTEAIGYYAELVEEDYRLKNKLKVVPKFEILI